MLPNPIDEPIAAIKKAVNEPHAGRLRCLALKLVCKLGEDTVFVFVLFSFVFILALTAV